MNGSPAARLAGGTARPRARIRALAFPETRRSVVLAVRSPDPRERARALDALVAEISKRGSDRLGGESPMTMGGLGGGGPEPWETSAENEAWRQGQNAEMGKLSGLRSIAEGLGNIHFSTVGELRHGGSRQQPFVAEGIREQMGERSDLMSPAERAMVKDRWGMDLPEDATWSRVSQSLPALSRTMRGGYSDWASQQRLDLQRQREEGIQNRWEGNRELRKEALGQAEQGLALRTRAMDLQEFKATRPPSSMQEMDIAIGNANNAMNRLQAAIEKARPSVGPVMSRIQSVLRKFGLNSPQYAVAQSELITWGSSFSKQETGVNRGMVELEWLMNALPQITDSEMTFDALMAQWQLRFNQLIENRRSYYKSMGYKTDFLEGIQGRGTENPETTTASHDKAAMIPVVNGDGVKGYLPAGTDLSKLPGWTRR